MHISRLNPLQHHNKLDNLTTYISNKLVSIDSNKDFVARAFGKKKSKVQELLFP